MKARRHAGFTLIELLVVIAIIGVLIALLLPAVQQAREAARRTQCKNNIHQVTLGLHNYHDAHTVFPYGSHNSVSPLFTPPKLAFDWMAYILPFVDQAPLYNTGNFDRGYNNPVNQAFIHAQIPAFYCPTQPGLPQWVSCCGGIPGVEDAGASTYSATSTDLTQAEDTSPLRAPGGGADTRDGSGVIFTLSKTGIRDITDGTSNTLVCSESYFDSDIGRKNFLASLGTAYCPNSQCYTGQMWAFLNVITTAYGINKVTLATDPGIFSFHVGGAHAGFADGHVQFLSQNMNQATLKAITTRKGGEVPGDY